MSNKAGISAINSGGIISLNSYCGDGTGKQLLLIPTVITLSQIHETFGR